MKKIFFIIGMFCFCAFAHAEILENGGALSGKVILGNGDGYFVLSNGNIWKVLGLSKNWENFAGWCESVNLTSQYYESAPNGWDLGVEISVYPKPSDLGYGENDPIILQQSSYVLSNNETGKMLFAIPLKPEECLSQLYKEADLDGYNRGLEEGKASCKNDAEAIYKQGVYEGYNRGLEEGKANCQNDSEAIYKQGFYEGYNKGLEEGKAGCQNDPEAAYKKGFNEGYNKGLEEGKAKPQNYDQSIYYEGYKKGFDNGYDKGFTYGYKIRHSLSLEGLFGWFQSMEQ